MTIVVIVGTLIIVGVTILVAIYLERKTGVQHLPSGNVMTEVRRKAPVVELGDSAATAFRVGDAQLAKLRVTQRCPTCRGEMSDAGDDQVRYDDRDLLVLHFACSKCQTKRTLYVEHRA